MARCHVNDWPSNMAQVAVSDGRLQMDPDFRIDAAYARKEFGDRKPELVDYLLWSLKFVTKSDYVSW